MLAPYGFGAAGEAALAASSLAVDVLVTTHQSPAAASITSPVFTTHQANELRRGRGKTPVDQYLAPVGDTYWVQRQTNVSTAAEATVTIDDTSPTGDLWNLAIIEVRGS